MNLKISDALSLPLEAVTETFGLLAQRGAGKSNAAVVMAEEMYRAGLHWVAIDPKGDWWGLRSSRDGSGPGLPIVIFGGSKADVPLEPTGGPLLADLIVNERITCVLDVSEFTEAEKTRFLAGHGREEGFAGRLFRKKNRDQDPTHLFLEEAHDYIPQQARGETAKLIHVFGKLVTMGRTRGLGATLISQRSARIHKDVLTQIGTLIVLRTIGPQDRKAIASWLEYHGQAQEIMASLPGLADGEAWVWSPEWLRKTERVRFRLRETYDSGSTPRVGKSGRRPATLADVDLAAIQRQMSSTIERAKAEDPRELRRRIVDLEATLAKANVAAERIDKKVDHVQVKEKRVEVPVLRDAQVKRLEAAIDRFEKTGVQLFAVAEHVIKTRADLRLELQAVLSRIEGTAVVQGGAEAARRPHKPKVAGSSPAPASMPAGASDLTGPEQRIVNAVAWCATIGIDQPHKTAVAFLAGYKANGGAFNNPCGSLRSKGFIIYPDSQRIAVTHLGRPMAQAPTVPLTTSELHRLVLLRLPGPEQRLLRPLLDAYPGGLANEELAEKAGYQPSGGAFNNPRGRLRTLGLIEYREGRSFARGILFLER